jgi:hypothetical protein
MNSLFNYELDERNIRLTLKEADLQFSESAWEDFDRNFNVDSPKPGLDWKMPKIELNINRNVMVPVLFIVVLGGISAMLFSFVDFKSNKKVQVEKTLDPNPDNYKKENTPVLTQSDKQEQVVNTKSPIEKSSENKVASVPMETVSVNSTPLVESASQQVVVTTNTSQMVSPDNRQAQASRVVQRTDSLRSNSTPVVADQSLNTNYKPRKKKKHITAEQIEPIKAPSLVGPENGAEEEQELKLQ